MDKVYHVSVKGSDRNKGTEESPFASIQKAADVARAGDRVVVHEGVYREWVKPRNGGLNDSCRIIYEAAPGEHAVLKGSERIVGWDCISGTVWKVCIPVEFFDSFNPYTHTIKGDWLVSPLSYEVHRGEIYLNGKSLYEAPSLEEVLHPCRKEVSPHETWGGREERILDPDRTVYEQHHP